MYIHNISLYIYIYIYVCRRATGGEAAARFARARGRVDLRLGAFG